MRMRNGRNDAPDRVACVDMLIRAPAPGVFHAFVEPAELRKFWLKDASGPLSAGARVEWAFMVPGAVASVVVTRFEPDAHIAFDWGDSLHVAIDFETFGEGSTKLTIRTTGFQDDDIDALVDVTKGFTIVLCDLKILLETGRSPNLVRENAELIVSGI